MTAGRRYIDNVIRRAYFNALIYTALLYLLAIGVVFVLVKEGGSLLVTVMGSVALVGLLIWAESWHQKLENLRPEYLRQKNNPSSE